jgi:hypothetical protein
MALTVYGRIFEAVYEAGANSEVVEKTFFTATFPCQVIAVRERHTVAGSDAGAVSIIPTKVPSGTTCAAGTDLLSAVINLKATADTNQSGTLSATETDLQLATGDSLGVDLAGVLTGVTGVSLTVVLKAIA